MKTINAYGYKVTGIKEIITEIEENLQNKSIRINWKNFNSNKDRFWNKDGSIGYPVFVNEKDKTVFIGNYIEYSGNIYITKSEVVEDGGLLNV